MRRRHWRDHEKKTGSKRLAKNADYQKDNMKAGHPSQRYRAVKKQDLSYIKKKKENFKSLLLIAREIPCP